MDFTDKTNLNNYGENFSYTYYKNFSHDEIEVITWILYSLKPLTQGELLKQQSATIELDLAQLNTQENPIDTLISLSGRVIKIFKDQDERVTFMPFILKMQKHSTKNHILIEFPYLILVIIKDALQKFPIEVHRELLKLQSRYATLLYRLFRSGDNHESALNNKAQFTLDDLKHQLNVSEHNTSYAAYSCFRERVIDQGIREINQKTDLLINYDEIKQGKKVIALNFKYTLKPNPTIQ